MKKPGFTVIIATHNRVNLLRRGIDSVLRQNWPLLEIIVIDDCSTDETSAIIPKLYPSIKYLYQECNQGPGPARNRGLKEAQQPWALILDDDDTLMPDSLMAIANFIESFHNSNEYPVLNFACNNGYLTKPFMLVKPVDYFHGTITGDFVPVINVHLFLKKGFAYPGLRIGGEHLLWWEIAEKYGIPSWGKQVCNVHDDAPSRLTSYHGQMQRAQEYAIMQDLTLERFGKLLNRYSPETAMKKWLGAATYWLLAGERRICRERLKKANNRGSIPYLWSLWLLSWLPLYFTRILFLKYKERF